MARISLWTPLLLILTVQLVLLIYLNAKTSPRGRDELVAVYISASDTFRLTARSNRAGSKPRKPLVNVDQIEAAPGNTINDGVNKNEVDREGFVRVSEDSKLPVGFGAAIDNSPSQVIDNVDSYQQAAVKKVDKKIRNQDGLVRKEEKKEEEAKDRADIVPQVVGRDWKRNGDGDSVKQRAENGGAQAKPNEKKRVGMRDVGALQMVDSKVANVGGGGEDGVMDGRRKVNQVSMLKSRDQDREAEAAAGVRRKEPMRKTRVGESEKREYNVVNNDKLSLLGADPPRNLGKSIEGNPAIKDKGKIGANSTATKSKRSLIEKVGQLKRTGYGRFKDMPFMLARRYTQEDKDRGLPPPKPNMQKLDELSKYADKLNYFDEFCTEVSEPLVECGERAARELTEEERVGLNIMFTLRTTLDYHDSRLPVLFETWLSMVDPRTIYIVTDGEDAELDDITENIGMHYVNAQSGTTHSRSDLCCKAGVELELMFYQHNDRFNWLCHVDDDIYVNIDVLVKTLAKFDPKEELVYFGRSGSPYGSPRLVKNESKLGTPNTPYHFAVGGMYCLSRRMLELAKDHLVGCEAFSRSCLAAQEPEDVTVGLVIGAVLNQELSRTEMIYTHGIDLLSSVPSPYLNQQIAFAYGYGSVESWHHTPNVVYAPGAVFNLDEDNTQFKSIHCYLYPNLQWCLDKKKHMAAMLEEFKLSRQGKSRKCVCTWKSLMCCDIWKEAYRKSAEETMKQRLKEKAEKEKKKEGGARKIGAE